MMIADYHAITIPQDPKMLSDNILFAASAYIAAGIDPKKTVLFQQSKVSAHTELGWILQTLTHMGEAERMTQFKDKSGDKREGVSVGLFTYPTLMAADILLYDVQAVPVGVDQKQHLELTRDLAERFNNRFGELFKIPDPLIREHGAKILGLNDPEKKMSKSATSAKNYISIMDDPDTIHNKIRSAVTDSERGVTLNKSRSGLYNLLTIYSLATNETLEQIVARYDGLGIKELKDDLADSLVSYLEPIQSKIKDMMKNPDELRRIIKNGSDVARAEADEMLGRVKEKIGVSV